MNDQYAQELMDAEDPFDQLSSSPSINEEEIDFHYVYALKNFFATEQGQANAHKGDAMILLNDANSYWWLVRLVKDSSVGFLPAEHIETPWERLARLNKHRNGDLCAADAVVGPTQQGKGLGKLLKNNRKKQNNRSVNFATSATYVSASEYEYDDEADDEDSSEDEGNQDKTTSIEETTSQGIADVVEEKLLHSHERDESRSPPPKIKSKSEKLAPKKTNGLFGLMSKMARNNSQIVGEDLGAQILAEPDTLTTPDDDSEKAKRRSLLKSKSSVEQIQVKKKKEALKLTTQPANVLVPTPSIESNDSSSSAQSQSMNNASGFNLFKRRKSREQLSPVDTKFQISGSRTANETSSPSAVGGLEIPTAPMNNALQQSPESEQIEDKPDVVKVTDVTKLPQRTAPPPLVTSTIKPLRLGNNLQGSTMRQRARPQSAFSPSYGEKALFPVNTPAHYGMRNVSIQSQDSSLTINSIQSESDFKVSFPVAKSSAGQRYPNSRHPYDNYLQLPSRQRLPLPRVQNRQLLAKRQSVPAFHSHTLGDDIDNLSDKDKTISVSIDDWTRESMWNTKRRSNVDVEDTMVYLSHIGLDSAEAKSILEGHGNSTPPLKVARPREVLDNNNRHQLDEYEQTAHLPSTQPLRNVAPNDRDKSIVERNAHPSDKSNGTFHSEQPLVPLQSLDSMDATLATEKAEKAINMDVYDTHDSSRDLEELVNGSQLKASEANLTETSLREDDSDIIITSTRNVDFNSRRETTQSWVTEQSHNLIEGLRSYSSQSQQSDSVESIPASAASLSTLPTPVTIGNGSERSHSSQSTVSMSYFDRDNESPSTEQDDPPGLQRVVPAKESKYLSPNPSLRPSAELVAPSPKEAIASDDYLHPDIVPLFKDTRDRLGILSNKLDALLQSYHR